MIVVGLMSGSSIDGIDAVACDISEKGKIRIIDTARTHYSSALREELIEASEGKSNTRDICRLDTEVAKLFAKTVLKIGRRRKIDLIGSHGQTISHLPKLKSTLQIGSGSIISAITSIDCWYDFRRADMIHGGQGAPLAPVVHLPLFASRTKNRAVINIGGIANVTLSPKGAKSLSELVAYDTGPGNMPIDIAVSHLHKKPSFDKDGKIARSAEPDKKLLKRLLAHPYFRRKKPKSTGREDFGSALFEYADISFTETKNLPSVISTMTRLTAMTIAKEIKNIDHLIITGGGAKNSYLVESINDLLPEVGVMISDEVGIGCMDVEGALIAWLAWLSEKGKRIDLSPITGGGKRNEIVGVKAFG